MLDSGAVSRKFFAVHPGLVERFFSSKTRNQEHFDSLNANGINQTFPRHPACMVPLHGKQPRASLCSLEVLVINLTWQATIIGKECIDRCCADTCKVRMDHGFAQPLSSQEQGTLSAGLGGFHRKNIERAIVAARCKCDALHMTGQEKSATLLFDKTAVGLANVRHNTISLKLNTLRCHRA